MKKRMLRKHALECAVHIAVTQVMHDELILHGNCHKQIALESAGYKHLDDYVRWDYVRENLEAMLDEEIVPVAARFWKMKEADRQKSPKKALASGYGKKTAGFVLVSWSPEIAQQYLAHKESVRRGITEGANGTAATLGKHNVPLLPSGGNLRDIDDVEALTKVTDPRQLTLST